MKKYIFWILGLTLFAGCNRKGVKLIYSPDRKYCISQLDITEDGVGYTIFAYGKFNPNSRLPSTYIKARYRWRDTWYGLIKWNGAEATFYYTYYDFEAVNLESSLLRLDFMQSEQDFFSYFFDKVPNDYIKVSTQ